MSLLNCLQCHQHWINYYDYTVRNTCIIHSRDEDLFRFIRNREYVTPVAELLNGKSLSYPQKRLINKVGSNKKRTVYTFSREENYILKILAFILIREYDYCLTDNLYSFRVNHDVKKAIGRIINHPDIDQYYSYKIDVSDYFNSIDIDRLLTMLQDIFGNDTILYNLFKTTLGNPYVICDDEVIEERKGVMAGTPTAAFFANIYLSGLDALFQNAEVLYCRYSDDIIVFAKSIEEIEQYKEQLIIKYLHSMNLSINESKEVLTHPGEPWTFLGFSYHKGDVDISPISLQKLKAKMRRKTRALRRWCTIKHKPTEAAARAFVKRLNKKFYSTTDLHETNWSRWYFPLLTTDKSLKQIDLYAQECIRFIISGRHAKSNYNYRYSQIKELGYRNLVRSWWAYRSDVKIGE